MKKRPLRFVPDHFHLGFASANVAAAKQAQKILNHYLRECELTCCDDDVPYPAPEREYRMVPTGKVKKVFPKGETVATSGGQDGERPCSR